MNKANCTKGPTTWTKDEATEEVPEQNRVTAIDQEGERIDIATVHHGGMEWEQFDANTALIAEAFNILHETGFTPAELAAQVTELREALQGMRDYVDGKKGELSDPLGSMDEALENSQPLKG